MNDRRPDTPGVACVVLIVVAISGLASAQQRPLAITSPVAYQGMVGTPLQIQLTATAGSVPYTWKLQAPLPPGLKLDEKSGLISGNPSVAGEFRVPVVVTDLSGPPQQATIELIITVVAALEVRWNQLPQMRNGSIDGSVVVFNHTGRVLDLTVIIVAVNEFPKAFALGYQHFAFKPNSKSPVIPFGAQMPFGSYIVHVDAVGEDLPSHTVYRSRLQTSGSLTLQQQ